MRDLNILPRVRDSWTYLYVEHAQVDQDGKAIALHDASGKTPVPCASLMLLMLGPGTSITHAAIRVLAETGCLVLWTGEQSVRFYAQGMGETRSARRLLLQARLWANERTRLEVVMQMYRRRFEHEVPAGLSLQQIRGMEGIRVREAYAQASQVYGVPWHGRSFKGRDGHAADPVNRALSAANSTLYGVCHSAIVAAGYSPALGFIHTGKMLSFVYDIADLYKVEMAIPAAFQATIEGVENLERRVRLACRESFHRERLLPRIVQDIDDVLRVPADGSDEVFDRDESVAGGLWDPVTGQVPGGLNYGDETGDPS